MRIPIIAGNWKMHMTEGEATEFVSQFKDKVSGTDIEIVLCPPYTILHKLVELTKDTKIAIGAQNMHWEEKGAFTGEISPLMLKDMGVDYCIIGHSERRQYFNETNDTVNKKLISALKHGIKPILCVGETLEERKAGDTEKLIKTQIVEAFNNIQGEEAVGIVVAYEPIWAIGTGETATPEQANDVIAYIRETLKEMYSESISEEIRIQYGGSVKPNNVVELMNQVDIDGALVGGASLKADSFSEIVNF